MIIPTLNEEPHLGAILDALSLMPGDSEVIVVVGGSHDRTVEIARNRGAVILAAGRGRGWQMHAGDLGWVV